jgi:hypothetical protein
LIRWYYYPPPYYDTINHIWKYRHPWLYLDGDKHGGRDYVNWRSRITQRLDVPASVTIRISGSYDPLTRNGTMRVVYRNDSTGTIHEARAIALITEDSIRHLAPSGDSMFNNVARDYVPDPYGQIISIPPGDSAVISQYFTADTSWNVSQCMINTWLQNDSMTADSIMPVYQGAKKKVSELDQFVWEESAKPMKPLTSAFPNPCHDATRFAFSLGSGVRYIIGIYDIQGRKVREIHGASKPEGNLVPWDCRDGQTRSVRPGVYFYRIVSDPMSPAISGKVIVR